MRNRKSNRAGVLRRAVSNVEPVRALNSRFSVKCEMLEARLLLAGDPIINEFMTKNQGGLADAAGDHPDWIEIYNPGSSPVNLASWTITEKDSTNVQTIFTFPTTNATVTTVAASGYKVIFCDTSSTPIQSSTEIHTNFNLDKSGGSLILTKPGSPPVVTSSYDPYPAQVTNVSYGIGPQITTNTTLIGSLAGASVKVPTDASLGATWTQNGFVPDNTWTSGTTGVGFENLGTNSNPPALPAEIETTQGTNDSATNANNASTNFVSQGSGSVYELGLKGVTLSSSADVDYYNIGALQSGDIISLSASGSGSSEGTLSDPKIQLFRAGSGTAVATDDDGGPGNDSLIDRFAVSTNDTYYAVVSAASSGGSTYNMGVYVENGASTTAPTTGTAVTTETESNNTMATANDLSTHWQQVNYLSQTTASETTSSLNDYYKYTFAAGDVVTITAHSTGTQRMRTTLYSSNGTTVLATDASSTADNRTASGFANDAGFYSYVIPTAGNYYVKTTSTAAGNYTLNVYLSTGTAPPAPGTGSSAIYTGLINTNIQSQMQGVNASAYVVVPFTVSDVTAITTLSLGMEYEDGFVAYINGVEVARSNAPGTAGTPLAFNAAASTNRADASATSFQSFDITALESALVNGVNVLAIQGLNDTAGEGRFLINPQLIFTTTTPAQIEYFSTPTPGTANVAGALGTVADPKLSKDDGFYEAPFSLTLSDKTSGAQIRYTTDGSVPTATTGTVYSGPITISSTTPFRAAAFVPGDIPSNVITSTFLFLGQVQNQTTLNQTLTIGGGATGGTFTLTFMKITPSGTTNVTTTATTSAITYSTSLPASSIATALNGLSTIGANGVTVSGPNGGPYTIAFAATFGNPFPITTGGAGSLTGGTPTIAVATNTAIPTTSYPSTWAGDNDGGTGVPSGSYPADYSVNPVIANPTGQTWTNADFLAGLTQVPTISLVTDPKNLFGYPVYNNGSTVGGGIYQLPQEEGDAWEEPASIEMMSTKGDQLFEDNVGLRTQGAAARQNSKQPKHSFRVLFKSEYGASTLSYPLFGPGTGGIDTIDFRATYNNSWTHGGSASSDSQRNEADYLRDGWNRVTQHNMGDLGLPHVEVQLYVNGMYWGLYDATDRPESSYFAAALGGVADNYEVLNAGTAIDSPAANPNETTTDWNTLNSEIDATTTVNGSTVPLVSTAAGYAQITQLVDPKELADYILQMFYAGNNDWDAGGHNWYVYRNATISGDGFKFIAWDSERTLEGLTDNDTTSINTPGAPSHIFHQLMLNAEFKQLFADRAHQALFNNGALTPAVAATLYNSMASQINEAIVDESARWGNYNAAYRGGGTTTFTRDNWSANQPGVFNTYYLINTYFPTRTNNFLNQLKTDGYYPATVAPEYSQFGGSVSSGYQLTITNSNSGGTIYYTLDGSDPRVSGGAVSSSALTYSAGSPPMLTTGVEVKARILLNGVWSALTDASFFVGAAPALRISEIMFNPANPPAGSSYGSSDLEYIELENTGATAIPLQGYVISAGVSFTFPKGLADLQPGAFIIVASNPTAFQTFYGNGPVIAGQFVGDLNQPTDELTVTSPLGQSVEDFTYDSSWYDATDGGGYSLVAVDPNATNTVLNTKAGWRISTSLNGEPGAADPGINNNAVIINELLSNSTDAGDAATGDWVELANTTNAAINIGSWYLSTDSNNRKMWQIPAGTMVPANGFITFTHAANFSGTFSLPDAGGDLYLTEGDSLGNVDGYRDHENFGPTAPGVTHGTVLLSTGSYDFPQLSAATFGATNAAPRVGPIVMNEIMYNPAGTGDEYIELQNITSSAVPLYDPANPANTWQFTNGITYTFPQSSSMPANAYALVVPIAPATFRTKYNIPASVQIFGPYTSALSNGGESVSLSMPGTPVAGVAPYITEDHVSYDDSSPWPTTPDGSGPSLERRAGNLYGNDPVNWVASQNGGTPGLANFANITGVSPNTGSTAGGTSVVITGTGFTGATSVTFGGIAASTFFVNSDSQITAVDPAGAAGVVDVKVTTPLGISGIVPADQFTYAASLPSGVTASPGAAFSYNSTTQNLSLTSGTLTFNNVGSAASLVLNVSADGAVSILVFNTTTYLNSLTLTNGATASITQSGSYTPDGFGGIASYGNTLTQANTRVLELNILSIPTVGGSNTAQGTLDLTNNAMILNYTGSSAAALAAADGLAQTGSDDGVWDGAGVTSSNAKADANNNGYTAVGVADNSDLGYVHFAGQDVSSNSQILFMYTWYGNGTLSGSVSNGDLLSFEAGRPNNPGGIAGTGWEYGLFDYNYTPAGSNADLLLFENGQAGYKIFGTINGGGNYT